MIKSISKIIISLIFILVGVFLICDYIVGDVEFMTIILGVLFILLGTWRFKSNIQFIKNAFRGKSDIEHKSNAELEGQGFMSKNQKYLQSKSQEQGSKNKTTTSSALIDKIKKDRNKEIVFEKSDHNRFVPAPLKTLQEVKPEEEMKFEEE